jgi:cytidyltransferase-like protein
MGDLMNHEGVVLRDEEKFGPNPVKITGEFILGNLGGGFGGSINEDEEDFIGYEFKPVKEEDESDDPVVDSDFSKTVAVVPGAFKPPHKGHLDMVRAYADQADEVVVIISKPTKKGRYLPDGTEITSEDSLKIWQLFAGNLPNVKIEASRDHASPVTAAYDFIGVNGPLNIGDKVILGASTKDDDWKRWLHAEKYVKDGVELLDPEKTAVEPTSRASGEPYSATAFRNALGGALENKAEIADFVGEENVESVLSILGLNSAVQEQSGAGAVAGAVFAGKYKTKKKNKQPSKLNKEDLNTVDEVMRLIMERGIMR